MMVIAPQIKIWEAPAAEEVGATATEFLRRLGGPDLDSHCRRRPLPNESRGDPAAWQ